MTHIDTLYFDGKPKKVVIPTVWCECKVEGETYYHPDNTCIYSKKHHWHCAKCEGLVQVG